MLCAWGCSRACLHLGDPESRLWAKVDRVQGTEGVEMMCDRLHFPVDFIRLFFFMGGGKGDKADHGMKL